MGLSLKTLFSRTFPGSSALIAIAALTMLSGCYRLTPAYLSGPDSKRAAILYEEGLLLEAKEVAERVGKEDPGYELSRLLISKIRTISIKVAKEHMEIAEQFEKAGLYRHAIDAYDDSLKFNPKNAYVTNRITALKGRLMQKTNDVSTSEAEPTDTSNNTDSAAKTTAESKINLLYLKGKAYLENEDYKNAVELLSAVVTQAPSYKDAKKLLDQARGELKATIDEHLKMGSAYFQNEQMELALEEWEAVLELDPENKSARDYRTRAKTILDRLEKIKESDGR